ncbi:MAG: DUF2190 family protein [Alphaproteobacteria bacterium]
MKNFVQPGETIDVAAPYDRLSGQAALVGAGIFGVCASDALSGVTVPLQRRGVFTNMAKATGAAWVQGDLLYWDNTAKNFTKTSAGNKLVGVAYVPVGTTAPASGDTTGAVLLPGTLPT